MNLKKTRSTKSQSSRSRAKPTNTKKAKLSRRSPKSPTRPNGARGAAARTADIVKLERDSFARQILDRLMPEFGPIDFTKAELFEEMAKHPTPEELIRQLASESET